MVMSLVKIRGWIYKKFFTYNLLADTGACAKKEIHSVYFLKKKERRVAATFDEVKNVCIGKGENPQNLNIYEWTECFSNLKLSSDYCLSNENTGLHWLDGFKGHT